MLTEDQFMKLFEGVMDNKKNMELLIRIDENTKSHGRDLVAHSNEDVARFALSKQSMDALHIRLDKVKEELVIEQDIQKKEHDKSIGFQNKLLGAILLSAFLIPIIVQIWFKQ